MADLVPSGAQSSKAPLDRRLNRRFPVQQEIRYHLAQSRSVEPMRIGRTLDVSSRGILFTTTGPLPVGRLVEIAMHWPAPLNGGCPLQLVASGHVLRSDGKIAAMRIQRYEFRTRSAAAPASGIVSA